MADVIFTHDNQGVLNVGARVGDNVEITLNVPIANTTGTNYSAVGVLPAGLILTNGVISGTPLQSGTFSSLSSDGSTFGIRYQQGSTGGLFYFGFSFTILSQAETVSTEALASIAKSLGVGSDDNDDGTDSSSSLQFDPDGFLDAVNAQGEIAIELDFDLISDQAIVPDVPALPAQGEESPIALPDWAAGTFSTGSIISVKEDDRFCLAIGFLRRGALQELDNIASLEIFCRVNAEERSIKITEGDGLSSFVKMTSLNRYKVVLDLDNAQLKQILKSNIKPSGGYVDLMAEIKVVLDVGEGSASETLERKSHTFAIRYAQKMS
jgi:hypothetical protein